MRSRIVIITCLIITLLGVCMPVYAAPKRYATCDKCGLCMSAETTDLKQSPPKDLTPEERLTFDRKRIPGDWAYCAKCLYANIPAYDRAQSMDDFARTHFEKTLLIGDQRTPKEVTDNVAPRIGPPETLPGKYYTQIACLGLGESLSEFDNPNISANVTSALLGVIQGVTGAIGFVYFLYGVFLVLTSRGDPDQLVRGRRAMVTSLLGILLTVFSVFILQFIAAQVLRVPGVG